MGIVTAGSLLDSAVPGNDMAAAAGSGGNDPSITKMEASQAAPDGAKNIEFAKDYGLT